MLSWVPQGDPWALYTAWLGGKGKGSVKVGDYCFPCQHGACPPLQSQAPVKASGSVGVTGAYPVGQNTVIFFDMVPVCSTCLEIWDLDPEFRNWMQTQYTDAKAKGWSNG
jgi:hypothetical protein